MGNTLRTLAVVAEDNDLSIVVEAAQEVAKGVELVLDGRLDLIDLEIVDNLVFAVFAHIVLLQEVDLTVVPEVEPRRNRHGMSGTGEDELRDMGERSDDELHFIFETQFETLVVFIEHDDADSIGRDIATLDMVFQSA